MIRELINRWFGYKWSLYVTVDERELRYVINLDSPIPLLGYMLPLFNKYGNPKEPWGIWLNYNKKHEAIQITKDCFTKEGNISSELSSKIGVLDPNYMRKAGDYKILMAEDCLNKKFIPFMNNIPGNVITDHIDFMSVMYDIFMISVKFKR